MKRVVIVVVVALGLGVWAGVRAWQSASIAVAVEAALSVVFAGNLVLCLWAWRRAQPGSGDAMVLPTIAALSASMLVGILPKVLWPHAETIQIAASIASMIGTTVVLVIQIRRRRELRRAARLV